MRCAIEREEKKLLQVFSRITMGLPSRLLCWNDSFVLSLRTKHPEELHIKATLFSADSLLSFHSRRGEENFFNSTSKTFRLSPCFFRRGKLLSLIPTPPALIRAEKRLGENFNFLSFFLSFCFSHSTTSMDEKLREREKKAFVLLSCAYKSFMNDCWILSSSQLLCQLILRCLSECFRWENCFSPLYFSFNYSSMGWV